MHNSNCMWTVLSPALEPSWVWLVSVLGWPGMKAASRPARAELNWNSHLVADLRMLPLREHLHLICCVKELSDFLHAFFVFHLHNYFNRFKIWFVELVCLHTDSQNMCERELFPADISLYGCHLISYWYTYLTGISETIDRFSTSILIVLHGYLTRQKIWVWWSLLSRVLIRLFTVFQLECEHCSECSKLFTYISCIKKYCTDLALRSPNSAAFRSSGRLGSWLAGDIASSLCI